MSRVRMLAAAALVLLITGSASPASAQPAVAPAMPDFILAQTAAPMSEAAIDSACAARALPAAGAAVFGGLMDALGRARAVERPLSRSPGEATVRAVSITAGWYAVLLLIGIVVLVFAGDRLRQVSEALERDTVGALVTGLLAGLASVPILLIATVVLALTLIGILLIPFALVALVLAYAGLAVLGLLAVTSVAGRAILGGRKERMTERATALAGLLIGVTVLLAAWFIAALFTWSPSAGLVLRSMALGLTTIAVTAGVGAVIRSFRRADEETEPALPSLGEDLSWQTPTPIGGVVAVRRSST